MAEPIEIISADETEIAFKRGDLELRVPTSRAPRRVLNAAQPLLKKAGAIPKAALPVPEGETPTGPAGIVLEDVRGAVTTEKPTTEAQPGPAAPVQQDPTAQFVDLQRVQQPTLQRPVGGVTTAEVPVARTVQAPVLGPGEVEARQELEAAQAAQAAGQEAQIIRQAELDELAAAQAADRAQLGQEVLEDVRAREQARQRAVDVQKAEQEEIKNKLLAQDFDFNSFWSRADTGSKIAAAFSVIVGGIAQGLRGGVNPGAEMLKAAIDRDVQQQIKGVELNLKQAELSSKVARDVAAKFADEDQRALAIRDIAFGVADQQLLAAQAKAANPAVEERLASAREQLRVDQAANAVAFETSLRGTEQQQFQTRRFGPPGRPRVGKGGAGVFDPESGRVIIPGTESTGALDREPDPTQLRKATDQVATANDAIAAVNRMINIREEFGTEVFGTEARTNFEADREQLLGLVGQMQEKGVLQQAEAERLQGLIGQIGPTLADIQKLGGVDVQLNKLKAMRRTVMNSINAKLAPFKLKFGGTGGFRPPAQAQAARQQVEF